jgi:hypothetical protein
MKLPPDSNRHVPSDETIAGACVAAVAEDLLPWRVGGRLPGYYLDFHAAHLDRHAAARASLIERIEEAIELLACLSRPDEIPEAQWIHWGHAFEGLAKTPETLLDLSGDEFRKFHLALWNFAHALGHPQ